VLKHLLTQKLVLLKSGLGKDSDTWSGDAWLATKSQPLWVSSRQKRDWYIVWRYQTQIWYPSPRQEIPRQCML